MAGTWREGTTHISNGEITQNQPVLSSTAGIYGCIGPPCISPVRTPKATVMQQKRIKRSVSQVISNNTNQMSQTWITFSS